MNEVEVIRKAPVKRVTNCGSCGEWYRITRMYHVHFQGIEKTMKGMVEKRVDEDRLVCPGCYEKMGYVVGKNVPEDDIEIITDPNYVKQEEIMIGIDYATGEDKSVKRHHSDSGYRLLETAIMMRDWARETKAYDKAVCAMGKDERELPFPYINDSRDSGQTANTDKMILQGDSASFTKITNPDGITAANRVNETMARLLPIGYLPPKDMKEIEKIQQKVAELRKGISDALKEI